MTTKTIDERLAEAIRRSESQNEIVRVDVDVHSGDVLQVLHSLDELAGWFDYSLSDYEGMDVMDVWGWHADTAVNQMDWRLEIHFKE